MLPITRQALAFLTAVAALSAPALAQDDSEPAPAEDAAAEDAAKAPEESPALTWTDAPVDPELAKLAERTATGDWMARRDSIATLASQYGGRGVDPLIRWIGSNADIDARVQAITALKRLGGDSVAAMIAGLDSRDAMVRRNLCLTLGEIGAADAAPAIMKVAQHDHDAVARSVAASALARIAPGAGAGTSAAGALVSAARDSLDGARPATPGPDGKVRVYFWNGRRVMDRETGPALAICANAKLLAEAALRLDPANPQAMETLVAAYSAMDQAIAGGGDATSGWQSAVPRVQDLLRLGGVLVDTPAVDAPLPDNVSGAEELVRSPDKRLRYKAALTLAASSPTPEVVATLGDALSESAIRQVLVIADDGAERNAIMASANGPKVAPIPAATGAEGLIRAKEQPVKDAVVIRSTVHDVKADRIVDILRRDVRTYDVPVIVVADENERERLASAFGDKVTAVVPAPVNAGVLKPALDAAFEKSKLNDERMDAESFARRAALALAALDGSQLAPAATALVGAIGRDDAIRIPALVALSKLGAPEGEGPALALLADASASPEARVAAAYALRGILAKNPGRPDTIHALETAARTGDAALRSAACSALGAAMGLPPVSRAALFLELSLPY